MLCSNPYCNRQKAKKRQRLWYTALVPRKVCLVQGQDHRGLPLVVLVQAATLFEAAASGLEQLHQLGGKLSEVEITVHEAGSRSKVRPEQLSKWLNHRDSCDNIGVQALKSRVRDLLNRNGASGVI